MTGFGLAEGSTPSGTYKVEIRGVNNRFLELQVRQPRFASNLEQQIKKEINAIISRGSVSVIITCDREDEGTKLTWSQPSVDAYMEIFKEIRGKYNLDGGIHLSDLLHFSDFIKTETTTFDDETLWKHLKPILLDQLQHSRRHARQRVPI